jgi:hypothetical protein
MFFHLLFIHLFRPFLKHTQSSSPLPAHVSPRKICTQAAISISKLLRLYKKTYGLKQICNIAVYIAHSACSIHLLNLPDKDARRDISHGVRHLEEIAECWLCAARTLATLSIQARRWKIELPEETAIILERWEAKYRNDHPSPSLGKASPGSEINQGFESPLMNTVSANNVSEIMDSHSRHSPSIDIVRSRAPSAVINQQVMQPPATFVQPQPVQPIQSNQQVQQAPPVWNMARTNISQSSPNRNSPTSMFGSLDSLFEESKDWWYRDQSTFFENWSRRESTAEINGTSGYNRMNNMVTDTTNVPNSNGIDQIPPDANMNNMNSWNYDTGYGYGDGTY